MHRKLRILGFDWLYTYYPKIYWNLFTKIYSKSLYIYEYLLKTKSDKEINSILKKLDLTHNDIDGPIGTAYVNYTDAVTRVNI